MPGMFQANIRSLPRINPDYRNVVEYGIIAGRKITCWSENRLFHGDIVGPFKTSAIGGYKYCLVLVDDHSREKFIFPPRNS